MKPKLLELIDFEKVNTLLEGFNKTTGFITAIIDLNGNVLSKSGWREICSQIHRINPETAQNCKISDTELANKTAKGLKYNSYKCLNGLVDVAVPLVIKGEHIANLFTGQFFFEKPDRGFFKKQAEKYGFDEKNYLEALEKVPVVSEEKVQVAMDFLLDMTKIISEMTLQKLEQTELNNKLKQSENTFRKLFEDSSDAILLIDEKGVFAECNQATLELLKMTKEQFLNLTPYDISPEFQPNGKKSKEAALEMINLAYKKGRHRFDWTHIDAEGREFIVDISLMPIMVKGGKMIHTTWHNITERKQAEKALREREEKMSSIYRVAPAGIGVVDNRLLKEANPRICEMTGYAREELIDENSRVLYPSQQEYDFVGKEKYRQIEAYGTGEVETRWKKKDGSIINVLLSSTPIDKNDYSKGVIFTALDITKRNKVEEALRNSEAELKELNAQKDKFFSIIGHDLKNPFNSIIGFSELLEEQIDKRNYDKSNKYVKIIRQSSHHAMDLLNNLLDWSRAHTGKFEFKPEKFKLTDFINEITLLYDNIAKQKSIKIKKDLPENLKLNADKQMIGTVIRNLISNAIKYTQQHGVITISAEKRAREIVVSISDNGIGIEPDRVKKLFRIDESESTPGTNNEKGTGLGLILCKEFVEKHEGKISVESTINKGTVFTFSLPQNND